MTSPFDYRELMKAQFKYNETRTVEEVLAEHKARDQQPGDKPVVSKEPPMPGRAPTRNELDALRGMLQGSSLPKD